MMMPGLQLVLACGIAPFGMVGHSPTVDAGHHVTMADPETLQVASHWLGAALTGYIPLALPLPAAATVDGADLERDLSGEITGIYPVDGDDVTLVVRVPMRRAQQLGVVPLAIAERPGRHRVTFDPSLSFLPGPEMGLAPHLRRSTTRDVSRAQARDLDARLGAPEGGRLARYASYGDLKQAGGFVGVLQEARERRRRLLLWVGAAFALVVAALAAAHRTLRRGADVERADALLAEEIDALGR